jgi:hypothetical protein
VIRLSGFVRSQAAIARTDRRRSAASQQAILVAGVAGLVAGSMSMAAGEISTASFAAFALLPIVALLVALPASRIPAIAELNSDRTNFVAMCREIPCPSPPYSLRNPRRRQSSNQTRGALQRHL